jgi:hypothetical protein
MKLLKKIIKQNYWKQNSSNEIENKIQTKLKTNWNKVGHKIQMKLKTKLKGNCWKKSSNENENKIYQNKFKWNGKQKCK